MQQWIRLVIDVDYRPSDPGINNWFCEQARYEKSDLAAGMPLRYKDPSDLFGGIRLLEVSDEGVVLAYGDHKYGLNLRSPYGRLDVAGRDYTEFELNVFLVLALVVEDTPAFYRAFSSKEGVAALGRSDIEVLEASDAPCAKYVLGRWHYLMAPMADSRQKAEDLLRQAAAAGVPDAFSVLSTMYSYGDTHEDRMDFTEMARWRDEALERGSELAALKYARNRVCGILLAPAEPEVVRDEIERRLASEPDVNPEWYSVLGYAYEELKQDDKAREVFEEGVKRGCLHCYWDLALMALRQEDDEQYRSWMEEGISAGCGWCCVLDADMSEEQFEAIPSGRRYHVTSQIENRLRRGLDLGEALCAYYLGISYYCGFLGFPEDEEEAKRWLRLGEARGDGYSCTLLADIVEEEQEENPSPQARKEAARLRLKALRYGDDSAQEKLLRDYREGLLDEYKEEIEQYWLPEEPDEDDGRWDAYV